MRDSLDSKIIRRIILIFLLLGLLFLLIWFIPKTLFPISVDFRGNLWEPSYLLVHQLNPYDIHGRFENLNPLWFPMIIGVFFPLGFLPLQWASNIWFALSVVLLFIIVALLARKYHRSVWWIVLAVFLLVVFPPTVAHFKYGQVSLLVSLLMLLLAIYRLQMKPVVIGLLLSLSFTKPQLIVLFLPAFLISIFRERGLKDTLKVIFFTAVCTAVLSIPLFIAFPQWFSTFIANLAGNPLWKYPSLYYQLRMLLDDKALSITLAGLYLLIGVAVVVFLSLKRGGFEMLLWSMALTPLFTPVLFSNDFVLIYPLLLLMVFEGKSRASLRVILFGFALSMLALFLIKSAGFYDDHFSVWVPLFLNGVLVVGNLFRRRDSGMQLTQTA